MNKIIRLMQSSALLTLFMMTCQAGISQALINGPTLAAYATALNDKPADQNDAGSFLVNVLNEIQSRYNVNFHYNHSLVNGLYLTHTESFDPREDRLDDVLKTLLQPFNLECRKVSNKVYVIKPSEPETRDRKDRNLVSPGRAGSFFVSPLIDVDLTSAVVIPQFSVAGQVTDKQNGEPIPGVNVVVKGTTQGTVTNVEGRYAFEVEPSDILVFSFIGYTTLEVPVLSRTALDIALQTEVRSLDEVVVVGYGISKKVDVTGSIVSVNGEDLQRTPALSVSNAMTGLLPGVVIKNTSGEPGNDDATVLIRGRNTTGNNSPLVVVDGIPNAPGWQRINPNDIESVSVLKDASAAIYGALAANGVILITTKRGDAGKPTINYNFNEGINQPTRIPDLGNSATLAGYFNEMLARQGQPARYTDEEIQKFRDGSDPLNYPNIDWYDEVLKDYSTQSQHNLSVSGGSSDIKYLISGSYVSRNSMFKGGSHQFRAYTLRSNIDAQVSKNIKVSLDVNGGIDDGDFPAFNTRTTFQALNNNLPFMPAYYPNGLPSAGVERGENPAIMASDGTGNRNERVKRFSAKAAFDITVPWVEGLGVDGYLNYVDVGILGKNWRMPWTVYNYDKLSDSYDPVIGGGIVSPQLEQSFGNDRSNLINLRIKYDKQLSDHNIKTFLAVEQSRGYSSDFSAFRRDFISDELDQLFAGSLSNQESDGRATETARKNFFGRAHYDFKEKYLLDFNFRYDGSSNFPKGKRYGFFPGVSVAWKLSEENFLRGNNAVIDNLKVRASIGQMGNDRIAAFQFLRLYNVTGKGYHFGDPSTPSLGLTAGVTPNPDVTWEVATISNIGLDGSFWNDMLGFTFDVFKQRRSNILATRSLAIPVFTGLSLPNENIGVVENKGFEVELSHANTKSAFSYRVAANMAYARNEVLDISEAANVPEWQKAEGHAIGADRYYVAEGIIRTQEELGAIAVWPGTEVGDLRYKDVNNDGVINASDRVRLDETNTPRVTFGVNVSMNYKRFSLFANFVGANRVWQSYRFQALLGYNALQELLDNRYTPGSMNSKYPTLPLQSGVNSLESTFWLYDVSYVRLKTLDLGYDLPESLLSKLKIKSARVYINGSNLFTFSKMKLFDPEGTDGDGFFYPQSKIYNLGVNLSF